VYVADLLGTVHAIDAKTGAPKWTFPLGKDTPGMVYGGVTVHGGPAGGGDVQPGRPVRPPLTPLSSASAPADNLRQEFPMKRLIAPALLVAFAVILGAEGDPAAGQDSPPPW
jgi:hypothetical protein